jgi:ParB-like chromosome segregation protein Spo0J
MKIKLQDIIGSEDNVRVEGNLHFRDIASICERGLDKPLLVRIHPTIAGMFEIVQGHRRKEYIFHLKRTNPSAYAAHFKS